MGLWGYIRQKLGNIALQSTTKGLVSMLVSILLNTNSLHSQSGPHTGYNVSDKVPRRRQVKTKKVY